MIFSRENCKDREKALGSKLEAGSGKTEVKSWKLAKTPFDRTYIFINGGSG